MECQEIDAGTAPAPAARAPDEEKRRRKERREAKRREKAELAAARAEIQRVEAKQKKAILEHNKKVAAELAWRAEHLPPTPTQAQLDKERRREEKRVRSRMEQLRELRAAPATVPQPDMTMPKVIRPLTVRQRHHLLPQSKLTPEEARAYVASISRVVRAEPTVRRPEQWNADYVGLRMIEAFTVLRTIPMKIWPAAVRTCMPAHRVEYDDIVARQSLKQLLEPTRVAAASSEDLIRMEEALQWPLQFLSGIEDEFLARAVTAGALWRAMGQSVSKKCKKYGVTRSVFYDRMTAGHIIVAVNLIANSIPVT